MSYVLVTDPGPDPDDVKAILALAVLHKKESLHLRAVVANGGHEAEARALLARAALDYVGAVDVAVGVGSEGIKQAPQPHEYDMPGYSRTRASSLRHGPTLLRQTIAGATPRSLTVVCISSLRDVADVIQSAPETFITAVSRMSIMGGVERRQGGLVPDTSTNNSFDMEAAAFVYNFCVRHGVPMTVTSRDAVPLVPMEIEHIALRESRDAMLGYLYDAQILGLQGLWRNLCAGKLPARCDKWWFFKTFCDVDGMVFKEQCLEELDASADIRVCLRGSVKPYDVVAVMACLPETEASIPATRASMHVVAAADGRLVLHRLLLQESDAPAPATVATFLRQVYGDVVMCHTAHHGA